MGRSVPMSGSGLAAYAPGRMYPPHGLAEMFAGPSDSLMTCPILVRPGVHQLAGLWVRGDTSTDAAVRLGLWEDNGGRPGTLIKDAGVQVLPDQAKVYAKAAFTPIALNGGVGGRMLHFGVVARNVKIPISRFASNSAPGYPTEALADLGLDPLVAPEGQSTSGFQMIASLGANQSGVATAAPLADSPPLSTSPLSGVIFGGLIFA